MDDCEEDDTDLDAADDTGAEDRGAADAVEADVPAAEECCEPVSVLCDVHAASRAVQRAGAMARRKRIEGKYTAVLARVEYCKMPFCCDISHIYPAASMRVVQTLC